jgi:hypothetical protein
MVLVKSQGRGGTSKSKISTVATGVVRSFTKYLILLAGWEGGSGASQLVVFLSAQAPTKNKTRGCVYLLDKKLDCAKKTTFITCLDAKVTKQRSCQCLWRIVPWRIETALCLRWVGSVSAAPIRLYGAVQIRSVSVVWARGFHGGVLNLFQSIWEAEYLLYQLRRAQAANAPQLYPSIVYQAEQWQSAACSDVRATILEDSSAIS